MADAKRDSNFRPALLGVSNADSTTPLPFKVDSSTGRLLVSATLSSPLTVAQGGTGLATMTAYAVLTGGTTSTGALQQVSGVGTSGQVLTSNGAAQLPTWQTASAATDVTDSTFRILDNADPTKKIAFEASGITTGTVRTITMPDANGTVTLRGNAVTGTGDVVLATTPTLVTPILGVATATSVNKIAITAPATSATLTLADGSTLVTSGANSITLTSGGATNVTLPTTGTLATLAGSETLSNKTLTAPKFVDGGFIADANGNEIIILDTVAAAINELTISNAPTTEDVILTATGGDTNIGISIVGKGAGIISLGQATSAGVTLVADQPILDANENELVKWTKAASAVNEITIGNGATTANATITASGETNAGITITGKGTKGVLIGNAALETVSVLTDGATPALDASLGNIFTLTAAGNRTIAVPSNAVSGQKIVIRHLASGAARTLALNTGAGGFRFGTDITALTETASGKTDYIGCIYNAADSFWDVVAYTKGF